MTKDDRRFCLKKLDSGGIVFASDAQELFVFAAHEKLLP
jgi:hypothetical protein